MSRLSLRRLMSARLVGSQRAALPPALLLPIRRDTLKVHHGSSRGAERRGRTTVLTYIRCAAAQQWGTLYE